VVFIESAGDEEVCAGVLEVFHARGFDLETVLSGEDFPYPRSKNFVVCSILKALEGEGLARDLAELAALGELYLAVELTKPVEVFTLKVVL
jgi:hypothetical protein